jgi:hypothetical protein
MLDKPRLAGGALSACVLLGAAGLAVGTGRAHSPDQPVRCEIDVSSANGMIVLQGVVHADDAVSGGYRFRVVSTGRSGGSDIVQGGDFNANPGVVARLGRVMLGGGGGYEARLEVTANGTAAVCTERVGGAQ